MNPHDLFVQGLGIIGLLFSVFSFQMNRHKSMMLMQIGACFFFGLQYFFLKAYTGTAVDLFSLIRNIIFIYRDKKWAKSPLWIVLFCIIFILSGVFTWDGIASLFMTLAMVINTISFSVKNPKLIRGTILVSSPMVLIYCIMTGSIGGIVNEILVEISSVVGLFRYDLKKGKKPDETEPK